MTDNLPAVRVETDVELINPTTDSWTAVLAPVVQLARSICGTDFVPDSLRDNVAGTTAAIMYGRELGLPPMTALGSTHMIKGRVGVSAEILRALVLEAGHEIVVRESSSAQVVMAGRRKGSAEWTTVTWTLDDAKRAKLGGDNWTKYPRQMLAARASAELCRLIFADVIHGMAALEELDEAEGPAPSAPASNGTTKVQRKRTTKSGAAGGGPAASDDGGEPRPSPPSSPPLPPLPGEPGAQTDGGAEPVSPPQGPASPPEPAAPSSPNSDGGADAPPASVGGPDEAAATSAPPSDQSERTGKPASAAMLRALHATFNRLGFDKDDRKLRLDITAAISGEDIASSNDLSHAGARQVSETLARMNSRADVFRLMKEIANAPIEDLTGEDEQ